jgi:predicted esterase
MRRASSRSSYAAIVAATVATLVFAAWLGVATPAAAQRAILQDGRELVGKFTEIAKIAEDPLKNADPLALTPILLCDDELRRTMVPRARLTKFEELPFAAPEVIKIDQPVALDGRAIQSVGPIMGITQFDQFGRRIFSMNSSRGRLDVIQGITEISPLYTAVRGLKGSNLFVWDTRLATSSIPRDVLRKVIDEYTNEKDVNSRLRLVRLLIQSERYHEAEAELKQVAIDFPDEPAPTAMLPQLRQAAAGMALKEIQARKSAGQHRLAYTHLANFPAEGVGGSVLQQVRQELEEFAKLKKERDEFVTRLPALVAEVGETSAREMYTEIVKEILAELSPNNFSRLMAFRRLENDTSLKPDQKLALAISGWLLGSDNAQTNSRITMSLLATRSLVRSYLTESDAAKRDAIYTQIATQESASPELLARLIAHMKPPLETPPPAGKDYYELKVARPSDSQNCMYYVVLPPEYDPYRQYPAIITLNGAGTTPEQQLDWWAGAPSEKGRAGQATRHGYIVIAPVWRRPGQTGYNASGAEHDCVLRTLRDACRRFSIDTDRIFLSGHSSGGDAAWEIGVSHPDYWAGIIPIVATTTTGTINHYTTNAAALPMYFVAGELDGRRIETNSTDWDRYFKMNYDVTVVEYRGRGHEHFSDEIQRIFDWMGRKVRDFFPKKFSVSTKRASDSFFWWVELEVPPAMLSQAKQGIPIEGFIGANNTVNITKAPGAVTVWLSPETVDFTRPVSVTVKGRAISRKPVQPDSRVLLDDVRTRGVRLHPFWAKVESDAK